MSSRLSSTVVAKPVAQLRRAFERRLLGHVVDARGQDPFQVLVSHQGADCILVRSRFALRIHWRHVGPVKQRIDRRGRARRARLLSRRNGSDRLATDRVVLAAAPRPVVGVHRRLRLGDAVADGLRAGRVRLCQAQPRPVLAGGGGGHRRQHARAAWSTTGWGTARTKPSRASARATSAGSNGSGRRCCSSPGCRWSGDPLCAVAGWLKMPFWPCVGWMTVGKFLRYTIMTAAAVVGSGRLVDRDPQADRRAVSRFRG